MQIFAKFLGHANFVGIIDDDDDDDDDDDRMMIADRFPFAVVIAS